MMEAVMRKDIYSIDTWMYNEGQTTISSYNNNGYSIESMPTNHLNFFNNLKIYEDTPKFFFVHAGIHPKNEIQTENDMLWIRDVFIASKQDFKKIVVFGHTPFSTPLIRKNKIGIDTGLCYGNKLTCMELSKGYSSEEDDIKFHFVGKIK